MNTAVIIVTYNSAATLAACLASVLAARQADDELIVVDNASRDATPAMLSRFAASVPPEYIKVILNPNNLGFSAAVNQGIAASRAAYIALLNPDTVVPAAWLTRLIAHMQTPTVAAVGPVSNFAAGRQSVACHWPGTLPETMGPFEAAERLYAANAGRSEETPLLIGFCMVVRRTLLEQLGGLDERLFLGNDDLELSWRLRLHGYRLLIACDCFVYHEGQHSFRTDPQTATGRLLGESSDALYGILEELYGCGRVPTPMALWGIDWFDPPSNPEFNQNSTPHQVLSRPKAYALPGASFPLTSIIILTWNQVRYTEECVEALVRNTPEPFEVIVVDNGSQDGTVDYARGLVAQDRRFRLIENRVNRGYAAGCNQGLEAARGDYLVLLNNDVVVTPGWLSGLLDCHHAIGSAGIVGPLTNNASGIQGLGPQDYGEGGLEGFSRRFGSRHRHRRVLSRRLVGFCMLFSRELYRAVGGLDEHFGTGNYEDDDLCLRAAIAGYRNGIAADVYIHHYGSVTFAGAALDYRSILCGNWSLFRDKWTAPVTDPEYAMKIALCKLREELEGLLVGGRFDDIMRRHHEVRAIMQQDRLLQDLFGRTLWMAGHLTEALALFPAATAAATAVHGMLSLAAGRCKEAEELLWQAVDLDPGDGGAYPGLARLAMQRGEQEYAAALLLKGISLGPFFPVYEELLDWIVPTMHAPHVVDTLSDYCRLHPDDQTSSRILVVWSAKTDAVNETVAVAKRHIVRFGCDQLVLSLGLAARRTVGRYCGTTDPPHGRSVSLAMIVKDEERHLPRCLESCAPLVQEMVVVDTGSSDHTPQLAELFGAICISYVWSDDFSAARNASLAATTGDWVLVMDADEAISVRDYERFKQVLAGSQPCGWVMTTRNYTTTLSMDGFKPLDGAYPEDEAGSGWTESDKVRLFPNRLGIVFEGLVHETVEASLQRIGLPLERHLVPVHHYGGFEQSRSVRKQKLYYQLGSKKLATDRNEKALYELALQAAELEKYDEAERLWRELLACQPDHLLAWLNLGYLLLRQGRLLEAESATRRALELQPDYPAALTNLGICLFCREQPDMARGQLVPLLAKRPDDATLRLLVSLTEYLSDVRSEEIRQEVQRQHHQFAGFIGRLIVLFARSARNDEAERLRQLLQAHA